MALTLGGTETTQLAQPALGVHWLIEAYFTTGTVYVTTAPENVTSGGQIYIGLGSVIGISEVTETGEINTDKLTLTLPLANDAHVQLLMGDVNVYRGRQIKLYMQLFNENFVPVGAKTLRWVGYMSPVSIKPSRDEAGNQNGKVELPLIRAGLSKFRNFKGLRLTHNQQVTRYPGDVGLQYLADLIEKPAVWLTKKFQFQD